MNRTPRAAAFWLLALALLTSGGHAADPGPYTLRIETVHNVLQGQYCSVPVTLLQADRTSGIGAFDLLIGFDNNAMFFQDVTFGARFDSTGCGWEYFTWRLWDQSVYPYGLIKLVGMAEVNDGAHHPSCTVPDTLPATLCTMRFLVGNDRTLECTFVPIRFYWRDCYDNSLTDAAGDTFFLSNSVTEPTFPPVDITDPDVGFPTFFGAQSNCDTTGEPYYWTTRNGIDFINGGIETMCAESIDARGDINLNGLPFEAQDAALFINYFLFGLRVFTINVNGQIASSDINLDGLSLSVADLVSIIRITNGDDVSLARYSVCHATATVDRGILSVDSLMGGAFIVLEGNQSISLDNLLAPDMALRVEFDGVNTRVLVYPPFPDMQGTLGFRGPLLDIGFASIRSVEMATRTGLMVDLTLKLVPDNFALSQNYPNPFNPTTTVSFALPAASDWSLTIHNALGQVIQKQGGYAEAGYQTVPVDASGWPSGAYFYTLNAGSFSQTKKMILLR